MLLMIMIAALILGGAEPGPVRLERLPTRSEALVGMPRAEIKIETNGQTTTYQGVALISILDKRANPVAGMAGLRDLADAVLLVRGADGYQAAVSAASVAMDPIGARYLLANSRDGQPMPLQLIIPGDPKHVRWVKDVVAIHLVRLNSLITPDP